MNFIFAPFANFETSGALQISAEGSIGFTLGLILGNAVAALDDDAVLETLNSNAGVRLNTNLALSALGPITPLVGRLSADASFTVTLVEGGMPTDYVVTLAKADDPDFVGVQTNTDDNTTLALLSAGAIGELRMNAMEEALRHYSALRRAAQQAAKAAVRSTLLLEQATPQD